MVGWTLVSNFWDELIRTQQTDGPHNEIRPSVRETSCGSHELKDTLALRKARQKRQLKLLTKEDALYLKITVNCTGS